MNGTLFDMNERIYVGRQTIEVAIASQAVTAQRPTWNMKNEELNTIC